MHCYIFGLLRRGETLVDRPLDIFQHRFQHSFGWQVAVEFVFNKKGVKVIVVLGEQLLRNYSAHTTKSAISSIPLASASPHGITLMVSLPSNNIPSMRVPVTVNSTSPA